MKVRLGVLLLNIFDISDCLGTGPPVMCEKRPTCSVSVYVTWVSQMMLHKPFWSGHHGHVNLESCVQKSFLFTELIHSPLTVVTGKC